MEEERSGINSGYKIFMISGKDDGRLYRVAVPNSHGFGALQNYSPYMRNALYQIGQTKP
ncbi:hypothetical protein PILCRDRAFT_827471 [Piloderma croceum F 1598]|uniref:Uncharacterized protein n=1 Tax=Piloderma croceum (strain F 1598) TaxID=765440 RepID=A0A0C3BD70_PILCF|nr:hypothetical protein PILCRDRAFT_827471 [Piloderma croceum F 1598]